MLGRPPAARSDTRKAAERYVALVAAGKGVALWDPALAQQIFLGDQDFIDRMQAKLSPAKAGSKEIPRQQRRASVKPLQHYLDQAADRDAGILAALQEGHYSLTAIADAVGLSVSRVSRVVRRGEDDAG